MATISKTPSPVLPLPPLEYDVQYMNNLVRLLNFYITQKDNPGEMRGTKLELSDGTSAVLASLDALANDSGVLEIILSSLPTSSAGLATGQVWNDSGTLKIIV